MALPHAAGLASLLFGQQPSRTPADVKQILATTARKAGRARTRDGHHLILPRNHVAGPIRAPRARARGVGDVVSDGEGRGYPY